MAKPNLQKFEVLVINSIQGFPLSCWSTRSAEVTGEHLLSLQSNAAAPEVGSTQALPKLQSQNPKAVTRLTGTERKFPAIVHSSAASRERTNGANGQTKPSNQGCGCSKTNQKPHSRKFTNHPVKLGFSIL